MRPCASVTGISIRFSAPGIRVHTCRCARKPRSHPRTRRGGRSFRRKESAGFSTHLRRARGRGQQSHRAGKIRDRAAEHQLGKFARKLPHRADGEIRIAPAGHEIDEALAFGFADHADAFGDARHRFVGVEDVGLPATALDDLDQVLELAARDRPHGPVRFVAFIERQIDIDDFSSVWSSSYLDGRCISPL